MILPASRVRIFDIYRSDDSVPASMLSILTVHPMATNVIVMAILSVAFIVPAVWQFGRQD